MSRFIVLDSSPLGMVTNPKATPLTLECKQWLTSLLAQGEIVVIPEIADYEVRRELLRVGKVAGIRQLDQLKNTLMYIPIETPVMLLAAQLWAKARKEGRSTADPKALDGDRINGNMGTIRAHVCAPLQFKSRQSFRTYAATPYMALKVR